MKRTLLTMLLIAAGAWIATAQDSKPLPPVSLVDANVARGVTGALAGGTQSQSGAAATNPFFCPPQTCLYYAGDVVENNNENGLLNINNPGIGITDAEVWTGVRPVKNAVVTGATVYDFTTAGGIGTNPTPFGVRTGISAGNGGKLVCSTKGDAVFKAYNSPCPGTSSPCVVYYIQKLAKSCHLKAKKTYYVDMTPQYNDGSTLDYLMDQEKPVRNHIGWPIVWDKSYFNSATFGESYDPAWGSSGACGGIGCDAFDIALTGKQ